MKKDYSDSQQEIVQLKHQNLRLVADMHRQLENCTSTILNARQDFESKTLYQSKMLYNSRIII